MNFEITDIRSVPVESIAVGDYIYFPETDYWKEGCVVVKDITISPKGKILINKTKTDQLLCLLPGQKRKICSVSFPKNEWRREEEYGRKYKFVIDKSTQPVEEETPRPPYTVADLRRDLEKFDGDTKIMVVDNRGEYEGISFNDIFRNYGGPLTVDFSN